MLTRNYTSIKTGHHSNNSIVFEQATICYITHLFFHKILQWHMALSDKELNEIAYLARINIDKDSFPSLKGELEQILDLFEKLNSAETDEVEAMSHPLDLSQPTRPDKVTEEDQREKLQETAPSVQSGLFLVPKVIEGEN